MTRVLSILLIQYQLIEYNTTNYLYLYYAPLLYLQVSLLQEKLFQIIYNTNLRMFGKYLNRLSDGCIFTSTFKKNILTYSFLAPLSQYLHKLA